MIIVNRIEDKKERKQVLKDNKFGILSTKKYNCGLRYNEATKRYLVKFNQDDEKMVIILEASEIEAIGARFNPTVTVVKGKKESGHKVTRTLVGGALLGPVGAVAGAVSGHKGTEDQEYNDYDPAYAIYVTLKDGKSFETKGILPAVTRESRINEANKIAGQIKWFNEHNEDGNSNKF